MSYSSIIASDIHHRNTRCDYPKTKEELQGFLELLSFCLDRDERLQLLKNFLAYQIKASERSVEIEKSEG